MSRSNNKSNETFDPNVQVKVEPGTSGTQATTSSAQIMPLRSIKVEPGLSTHSTTRLTSFRVPRDLTLGGNVKSEKPKKVYTPNLNVQRNKKEQNTPKNESKTTRDRGRGRGRPERGRGHNKNSNLVQSTGVFSEGLSDSGRARRGGSGGSRDYSDKKDARAILEKPKINLNRTIDKTEEEAKLRMLLNDDFIDDGTDPDIDNAPVTLPMVDEVKVYKEDSKVGIAQATKCETDEPILQNGEVKPDVKVKIKSSPKESEQESKYPITVPQVLDIKTNNYILMQFPDCLPGLRSDEGDTGTKRSESDAKNTEKSKNEFVTMNNLKGGLLGKLQILKSGKARLVLGENTLLVEVGSHLSFRQDLIATKIESDKGTGELINLGPVSSTLVCSPDWESMLSAL